MNLINKYKNTIIYGLIAVMIFALMQQCNSNQNLKREVELAKEDSNRNFNNYLASKDSINTLIADNGNLISEIRSYKFDLSDLKQEQSDLLDKYKTSLNLNKDLNKVNTLLAVNVNIKDSIIASSNLTEIDSNNSILAFNRSDDFGNGNTRTLFGELKITRFDSIYSYGNPTITLQQTINLMAAIEDNKGYDEIKISTSYPGLNISNIENINLINSRLNKKQKKKAGWSVGVGFGYGINLNNNQVISTGPSIGLGVYYSPSWLRF
jgi:hypothetical protein